MNEVNFFNESKININEYIKELKKIIIYAINYEKESNLEFDVIFVDNKHIRELNKKYRNIDKETDVLSFALEDNKRVEKQENRILGDIYISVERAKIQADEYNHSLLRELSFLMIHGFLHLLGYNHESKKEEKIMFNKQELILSEYGIIR
ncbi:MAG: rRNA maturation RNase YbeY [Bacilli bacterium]